MFEGSKERLEPPQVIGVSFGTKNLPYCPGEGKCMQKVNFLKLKIFE